MQGTQFSTVNVLKALKRAKQVANGKPAVLTMDGKPYATVYKNGKVNFA